MLLFLINIYKNLHNVNRKIPNHSDYNVFLIFIIKKSINQNFIIIYYVFFYFLYLIYLLHIIIIYYLTLIRFH